ncbi:FAD-dependent monooxygenase [Streptomyces sp. RerS4]|uniref:FAD-dependent monooxygenase n=1 Tax=Streptomyces sp. RerS4 TaxID=2942449 RepID=UPI00201C1228|nr:FAD-dependent monooxygenase [Streptomyces sp. RerS4]UQX05445.1 FAD-dependent monooxygenase [Streptomyces sp. RerS4]
MTPDLRQTQVVVVGAGPVGLMLAGELRLGGADVVVLDRLTAPTTESRASTLHARTMEILDSRGLLDALGPVPNDLMGHFGGVPLGLALPGPYPGQWKVLQARTEALLGTWATGLGAVVRRGHEVVALTEHPDGVEVDAVGPDGPVRYRALCVVGCDGEDSAVRRLGGFAFHGTDASRELLRADVAGIDVPDRRFQRLERGLAVAARRPDGVTRVMVHEFGRPVPVRAGAPDFAEIAATWQRVTGEDISAGTPLWANAFDDTSRQVTRYRQGRVFLAGDAAHVQMPVGGQALNLGLQDAVNLGWKLAAHIAGRVPHDLLDTYHDERHAVGQRVLGNIRAQALLLLGGPETEAVREVFGELLRIPHARAHLAKMISALDVRHATTADDHPSAGARLPIADLDTDRGPTTTSALLRTGRGVLLDLTGDAAGGRRLAALARDWSPHVGVVHATASAGGDPLEGAGAALVRPDGHIAWTGSDADPALSDALRRWFGRPAPRRAPDGRAPEEPAPARSRTAVPPGAAAPFLGRALALLARRIPSPTPDRKDTPTDVE